MWSIYDDRRNVFELQEMLRRLSGKYKSIRLINPDSIFGPETTEAVMQAQNQFGLNPSGEVDFITWRAIYEHFRDMLSGNADQIIPPSS